MATFDAGSIEASLTLDRSNFQRELRTAQAEARDFERQRFTAALALDTRNVEGDILRVQTQLRNLARDTARVSVNVDTGTAIGQLTALESAINRVDGRVIRIRTDVDITGALAQIATLQAAVAGVSSSRISIGSGVSGGGAGGITALGTAANGAAGDIANLTAAAMLLAPALIPIAGVAAGATVALAGMAAGGVGVAGIFGAVFVKSIMNANKTLDNYNTAQQRLMAAQEAVRQARTPEQLAAAQRELALAQQEVARTSAAVTPAIRGYEGAINDLQSTWAAFVQGFQTPILVMAAGAIGGLTAAIPKLRPVMEAMLPVVGNLISSFRAWVMLPGGLDHVVTFLVTQGVPAFDKFTQVVRNTLVGLGGMFAAFAPMGQGIMDWLVNMTQRFREWATAAGPDSGVNKFFAWVQANGPAVMDFFRQLGQAFITIYQVFSPLAPLSLAISTGLLAIINAIPPALLTLLVDVFIAWRVATMAQAAAMVALNLSMGPVGWAIMGLIVVGLLLITHWDTIRNTAVLVWGYIAGFFGEVWARITAVFAAGIAFVQGIWDVAWAAIRATFEFVWNLIVGVVTTYMGIIRAVIETALAVIGAVWSGTWNFIVAVAQGFMGALGAAWGAFWGAIQAFAQAVWGAITGAWQGFVNTVRAIYDGFVAGLGAAWGAFWSNVQAFAQGVWSAITGIWQGFVNAVRAIYDGFASGLGAAWGAFWSNIQAFAKGVWDAIAGYFQAWVNFLRAVYDGFAAGLGAAWGAFWGNIQAFAKGVWDAIAGTWQGFFNTVRGMYDAFAGGLGAAWGGFWSNILAFVQDIWGKIQDVVKGAVNGVIGIVNGLIDGFNNITGFLQLDVHINRITPLANGGIVGETVGFAQGGVVRGYAPGKDTVPAILSPGEGVLTPEAVRGLGGPDFVHSANRKWAGHRGAGRGARPFGSVGAQFATGGMVGHVDQGQQMPAGVTQLLAMGGITLEALARAGLGGVQITQPEYNVGVAASAGTHDKGGVVDLPADQNILNKLLATGEWAAWMRGPENGFSPHIHAVLMNHPDLSEAAAAQVTSFKAGGTGLGVGGGGGGGVSNPLKKVYDQVVGKLGFVLKNVAMGKDPFTGIKIDLPGGGGGFLGAIKSTVKNVVDVATGGGSDGPVGGVIDFASDKLNDLLKGMFGGIRKYLLSKITGPILDTAFSFLDWSIGGLGGGAGDMALGMGKWFLEKAVKGKLLGEADKAPEFPAQAASGGGKVGDPQSVQSWAPLAAEALRRAGLDPGQLNAFLALMAAESGGDPNAINLTDINAQNGIPSQGLMQVIPPTFALNRDPTLPNNILDPLANMTAAAKYIRIRYDGIVPGSPYFRGTGNATPGLHLMGEFGPEFVQVGGGEKVYTARSTAERFGQLVQSTTGGDGSQAVILEGPIVVQIGEEQFEGVIVKHSARTVARINSRAREVRTS